MESLALGAAVAAYGFSASAALAAGLLRRHLAAVVGTLLAAGVAAHTVALALRWERVGHGPFISMFEVLSSNVWSLSLLFLLAFARVPAVRAAATVALPAIFVLTAWMLSTHPDDGHLPATYRTLWLYAHVAFGKIFLASLLVSAAVAVPMLVPSPRWTGPRLAAAERLALRFVVLAFLFESLMLVTGAIWAQDAWGRYWAWDPLETWSFLTWLAVALLLHVRVAYRVPPRVTAAMVAGVFVVAFLTFFGVPFVSTALHKGAV